MSIKRFNTYTAVCDWPGCESDVMDPSDYSGWGEISNVNDTIEDSDWFTSPDGKQHFCPDHDVQWASDHEDGEPYPEPPYLLIHDGDTGNPADDGRVTLVLPQEVPC